MARKVSELALEMADREAIRDVQARYCRAVDRLDEQLLRSIYWEDAYDSHIEFAGYLPDFIKYVIPLLDSIDQNFHLTGNMLIEINGNSAAVESYYEAFHRLPHPGEAGKFQDLVAGGRYVDRMEKREDEWRIAERLVMVDWYRMHEDSADWTMGFRGFPLKPGEKGLGDPSYARFASVSGK